MSWASVLAFAPLHNHPGKSDVTGAFLPEARRFLDAAGGDGRKVLLRFDNRRPMHSRAAEVLEHLDRFKGQRRMVRAVAFLCHGLRGSIQAGFRSGGARANVDDLGEAIAAVSGRGVIVPLYACSTAGRHRRGAKGPGGDGDFADELRDSLCRHGAVDCRVDAHSTAAHATVNPYVRRFEGRGSTVGGAGGGYIIAPGSRLWPAWRAALGNPRAMGELRLTFPWFDSGSIAERLDRAGRGG